MTKNVGINDKIIRVTLAAVVIALGIVFRSWWGLLGILFLISVFTGNCPLYTVLGVSTCKKK